MNVYMLDGGDDYMAYAFVDTDLQDRLMGAKAGKVTLPTSDELPLRMAPSFGEAKRQPVSVKLVAACFIQPFGPYGDCPIAWQ